MQDDMIHAVDMSPVEALEVVVKLCKDVIDPANDADELREGMEKVVDNDMWTAMLATNIIIEWAESVREFLSGVAASRGYKHDGYFISFGEKGEELN